MADNKGNSFRSDGWYVIDRTADIDNWTVHIFRNESDAADFIVNHGLTAENASDVNSFDLVDNYFILHGSTPYGRVLNPNSFRDDLYDYDDYEFHAPASYLDELALPVLVTKDFIWYLHDDYYPYMFSLDEKGHIASLASDNYLSENALIEELENAWYGKTEILYMNESILGSLEDYAEDYEWKEPEEPAREPPSKEEAGKALHAYLDAIYGSAFVDELIVDSAKNQPEEMVESNVSYTAVMRPQEERMVKEMPKNDMGQETQQQSAYANVKMPAAFVKPHEYTAKDGRAFEKAYVDFPKGTKVNGVDVSGFSCDVFMNDRMKQQMLNGEQVTLGFKADEPVSIWKGSQKTGDYQKFEVKPWDLCKGIKAANEQYKADKAAERAAEKEPAADLEGEKQEVSDASKALAGDAPAKDAQVKSNEQSK